MALPSRLLAGLLVVLAATSLLAHQEPIARPGRDAETRGMWVLRSSLASPAAITAMVDAANRAGVNTLLVQVRGRGEALYRSGIEPRARELDPEPPEFDPLALTITTAHQAGLRVHAWVNVNLVASGTTLPRSRDHIALRHPEWLMAPREIGETLRAIDPHSPAYIGTLARWTRANSDDVEGMYLSPLIPASQAYTVSVLRELVERYDLDGLHLDYIRYPSASFDYGAASLAEFRADRLRAVSLADRQRLDQLAASDATIWTRSFPQAWNTFRVQRLTSLVTQIRTTARAVKPALTISAAVLPNAAVARDDRLQDWIGWAASGLLDVVCPMIYTTDATEFAAVVGSLKASLGTVPVWAGIGAYRLPVDGVAANVRSARRAGAAGIVLFSYDSLTSGAPSSLSSLSAIRPVLLESGDPGAPHRR